MRSANPEFSRALAAEALGTGLLVCAVVGSGIMAQRLTHDMALALLCNTLATGAILFVLIALLAEISGAHFNPAVTLVMALGGKIAVPRALAYVAAQCAGAVCGTLCAHAMFAMRLVTFGMTARSGYGQCFAEAVASFGLVLAILGQGKDNRYAVAASVALYIVSAYWFTASTSFANPAVTMARALTASFAGIRPTDVPAFILAQGAGALAGWIFSAWLFGGRRKENAVSSENSLISGT